MTFLWGRRLKAVMSKEFIQMRRDKATFGMIVGIPLIQLILFGFAINMNPRHLPTAIVGSDNSTYTRRILSAMENSSYFRFVAPASTEQADATDPSATSGAVNVFKELANRALNQELDGSLAKLKAQPPPYIPMVHSVYNPLAITAYNIVPGLLGVVLTMTLVIITALAITREAERGTMENLLATPLRPIEVMVGKIVPYIFVGYMQVGLILLFAKFLFHVPMEGSVLLLLVLCLPFIAANLAVGLTFSTLATNQLQAVQGAMFFFLPSLLLSGFMFPFRGMPEWAQVIGNMLPLTHFLIIVRGILLKGSGFLDVWREIIPILGFMLVVMLIGVKRYRQTLD